MAGSGRTLQVRCTPRTAECPLRSANDRVADSSRKAQEATSRALACFLSQRLRGFPRLLDEYPRGGAKRTVLHSGPHVTVFPRSVLDLYADDTSLKELPIGLPPREWPIALVILGTATPSAGLPLAAGSPPRAVFVHERASGRRRRQVETRLQVSSDNAGRAARIRDSTWDPVLQPTTPRSPLDAGLDERPCAAFALSVAELEAGFRIANDGVADIVAGSIRVRGEVFSLR